MYMVLAIGTIFIKTEKKWKNVNKTRMQSVLVK